MTPDDMIDAVKTFLEFLNLTEYTKPVMLVVLQDADTGVGVQMNEESTAGLLDDFRAWLEED